MKPVFSQNFFSRIVYGTISVLLVGVVLLTTLFPSLRWVFGFFSYFVQFCALQEFFGMLDKKSSTSAAVRLATQTLALLMYLLHMMSDLPVCGLATFFLLALFLIVSLLYFSRIEGSIEGVSHAVVGFCYISIPLLFSIDLVFFPIVPTIIGVPLIVSPPFWLLVALFLAKGGDMAAYFCGKTFGKRVLARTLSPKKTIEGAIGGLIGSVVGFWVAVVLFHLHLSWPDAVMYTLLAAIGGILAQVSDLVESLFKRDAGVKDSSSYLPGLGGVLDIVDSLLFVVPFLFFIICYFVA